MTTENVASAADLGGPATTPIVAALRSRVGVRFEGVQRVFGEVAALAGLDLEIKPGELVALLGPSGCGKTTALRLLGGFDHPTSGTITVGGKDVTRVPASQRDMGMVFQAYSLFPNMNVRDNVAFGLRMRKVAKDKRLKRADDLLELVGLSPVADRYPHQLSGGQQQRVAIARALAIEPTVLLLDEPLSALDALVRHQLRAEIRSLQLRLGISTLFVTHDQAEALSIADRVGVMNAGRLEQIDTPENVYHRPATQFVAEFVGAMNRLPGRLGDAADIQILGQRVGAVNAEGRQPGSQITALVRPESIGVVVDSAGAGEITQTTFLGSTVRFEVKLDDGQTVIAEIAAHGNVPGLGTRVTLKILADAVPVVDASATETSALIAE